MVNLELIAVVLTAASMMAALVIWVIKAVVAPLRVSLDNNTQVMERVLAKLDAHDEAIDDHGNRITRIETAHSHYHKGE